jgi:hypothetical protein
MRAIATLLLLSVATNATAAIYKWVQPDGKVIYSDHPPSQNAAPAELPPVQEIKMTPPPPPSPEPDTQANQSQKGEYTKLDIMAPANDSTIRDNAGNVSVNLALEPPLQEGDLASLTLDGKDIWKGQATSLALSNVDRGTHTLEATIKNAQGATLITSPSVIFHLLRTSLLQQKNSSTPK